MQDSIAAPIATIHEYPTNTYSLSLSSSITSLPEYPLPTAPPPYNLSLNPIHTINHTAIVRDPFLSKPSFPQPTATTADVSILPISSSTVKGFTYVPSITYSPSRFNSAKEKTPSFPDHKGNILRLSTTTSIKNDHSTENAENNRAKPPAVSTTTNSSSSFNYTPPEFYSPPETRPVPSQSNLDPPINSPGPLSIASGTAVTAFIEGGFICVYRLRISKINPIFYSVNHASPEFHLSENDSHRWSSRSSHSSHLLKTSYLTLSQI